jgi:hypothetical protein
MTHVATTDLATPEVDIELVHVVEGRNPRRHMDPKLLERKAESIFPARGRLAAALTGMTIVVEGSVRSDSGAVFTARSAADLGREIGAGTDPSRASAGPNELVAGGAHVVGQSHDVLTAMFGALSPGRFNPCEYRRA